MTRPNSLVEKLLPEHNDCVTKGQMHEPVPLPPPVERPAVHYPNPAPIAVTEAWVTDAACRGVDPAHFFPDRGEATTITKQLCGTCPVRGDCLDYALEHGEKYGVWGGLSERQRRKLRAQRNRGAA